jgi:putative MATE family efflux protein
MIMDERNKKMELLSSTPIKRALLAMGLPSMIGMMISALYNLVDAYFVSGLGTSQMGAISVAFPLGQIMAGLGLLFGTGASLYISRLLGQKELLKANRVASTAISSCIIIGALAILIILVFLTPLLKLLGATASILPYALTYTRIYAVSTIFNLFNIAISSIMTSEGAAKTTMGTLFVGALVNIILDPIFIYSLDLGIAGSAYATAISQLLSTLLFMLYILRKKSIFTFHISDCDFSRKTISEIFKVGIPILIFQLLTSLAMALINMKASTYGDSAIAAMGATTRIIILGNLIVFGFIKGFQPIVGYSYGSKNYTRLKAALKITIRWTSLFCVLTGTIFIMFSSNIISQFSHNDKAMIILGQKALRANGFSFMFFGIYTVYSSLFLALGKAKEGFILGICRQGICFIPVILIFPSIFGMGGIIFAQPLADVVATVIALFLSRSIYKELALYELPIAPEPLNPRLQKSL